MNNIAFSSISAPAQELNFHTPQTNLGSSLSDQALGRLLARLSEQANSYQANWNDHCQQLIDFQQSCQAIDHYTARRLSP